jgi:tetratricopeptide (TPR) repeat protein
LAAIGYPQKKGSFVTINLRLVKFYTKSPIMKQLLFILTTLFTFNGFACLNESGTNLAGETQMIDRLIFTMFERSKRSPSQESIDDKLIALKDKLAASNKSNNDDIHTDLGAYMIYDGRYQAAIDYMHAYVKLKSSNYSFCSNIGVAHELVGNLDSALYFTQKGLDINPNSHGGSEWIHIKILEAEIAISKDKNWLESNSIFDFPIAKDSVPTVFPKDFDIKAFVYQCGDQLEERSFFVRKENQDPVFSQVILYYADAIAREFDIKNCLKTYELAADHDNSLRGIVNKRIAYLKNYNLKNGIDTFVLGHGGGLDGLSETDTDLSEQISDEDETLNTGQDPRAEGQYLDDNGEVVSEGTEKPKRKIIKGLIYYLGGGFVLLLIGMIYFIRKKPKKP